MKPISPESALSRLQALCSRSEQCESHVRQLLMRWQIPSAEADRIVDRLVDDHYIDHSRYAQAYVHDHLMFDHWGPLRIAQALRQMHIDSDIIDHAISHIDHDTVVDALTHVISQRMRSDSDPDRIIRYAMQRGFTYSDISQVIREL